jgi:hypothetical protein
MSFNTANPYKTLDLQNEGRGIPHESPSMPNFIDGLNGFSPPLGQFSRSAKS